MHIQVFCQRGLMRHQNTAVVIKPNELECVHKVLFCIIEEGDMHIASLDHIKIWSH